MGNDLFGNNLDIEPGLPELRMEAAVVRDAPVREVVKPVVTEPRVRIMLEENDSIPPTGLFLQADGRAYMIKPSLAVDVPMCIIHILDTAIMATPIVDPVTRQVTGFRDRLRFPYRVLAHVPAQKEAA